ncbi:MAG: ATPase [Clostridia bacterium]|nr:ATPase [Clostridia bacterium]
MKNSEIENFIKSHIESMESSNLALDVFSFIDLCQKVKEAFFSDWDKGESSKSTLDIQKKAIIGYEKEVEFFKTRIIELIRELHAEKTQYPTWYPSLAEGIYHENWGLAGISEWFSSKFSQSSSAKIIGERIYFLQEGKMVLKAQRISKVRKEQLIKAFLLTTPEERMDKVYHETYLLDGTRVTIFMEPMAKKNQSAIVFRRYVIPILTFEEQAKRGTIPYEAIPLFCSMVDIGFNVVFLGAVRTAKTTFLTTWQSYEDISLEGVMVETDPEIPLDLILPDAPILQLIADGKELSRISKNLLRSDADYFILAEARDGIALETAVKIAGKGTKRMKLTFHSGDPKHFPLDAADEIVRSTGGDLRMTMQRVANSFDYLFHFIQLSDKREKRLKSIHEMNCDAEGLISMNPLCEYDSVENSWSFYDHIGEKQRRYATESMLYKLTEMQDILSELSQISPIKNRYVHTAEKGS